MSTAHSPCIFCKQSGGEPSLEHIFPESFGSPAGLVLNKGEVCRPCNNRLSRLDSAVQDRLGPFKPMMVPRNKRGKPSHWKSGNVHVSARPDGGAHFQINGDPKPARFSGGLTLPGTNGPNRAILRHKDYPDGTWKGSLSLEMRLDSTFSRGVHKIAFEYMCFEHGPDAVLDPAFDGLRTFILRGHGEHRNLLMSTLTAKFDDRANAINEVCTSASGGPGWVVAVQLALIRFIVGIVPQNVEVLELGRMLNRTANHRIVCTADERGIIRDL